MNETTVNNSIGQLVQPEAIGYSFDTPGWYLVLGLLLLTAFIIAIFLYRKFRRNAYRREAVKKIERIVQQQNNRIIYEINLLLKAMALRVFGRQNVAALYGVEWFEFLKSTVNTKQSFTNNRFAEFTKALYDTNYKLNKSEEKEWIEFALLWVKTHKVNV